MSDLEVFDDRVCRLGEGPVFDRRRSADGTVLWVDILSRRVLWRDLGGAAGEQPVGADVGAAVPREQGGLVLCLPDGPVLADPDWSTTPLARYDQVAAPGSATPGFVPHGPGVRSNDAKADPRGRLWVGTMAYAETPGAGTLYRFDPAVGVLQVVRAGLAVSNGLGWSPDGARMYHVDSPTRQVVVMAYDLETGECGPARPLVTVDRGFPDGLCVDAEGCVWVALWDGAAVQRFDPSGRLLRTVEVPADRVTSCCFAGAGLDLLVVTTAADDRPGRPAGGRTYLLRPGVDGLPVGRFAG